MPHGRPTTATVAAATTVVAGRLSSISLSKMPCRISAGCFFDTSLSAGAIFGNDGQSVRYAAFDVCLIPVFCHSLASPAPAFSYITQPFHLPDGCCPPLFLHSLPALRCGLPATRLKASAAQAIFGNLPFQQAVLDFFGHMWELHISWAFVPLLLVFGPVLGLLATRWDMAGGELSA